MRLVYSSSASPSLAPGDVARIGEQSARNNLVHGLTGLLVHHRENFFSVLEGPRRRVFARMELIATDSRHHGLHILREDAVSTRRFLNWHFTRLPDGATRPGEATISADFIRSLSLRL